MGSALSRPSPFRRESSESDLEASIARLPGVAECVVLIDSRAGAAVRVAYVVPAKPLTPSRVAALLAESGNGFALPDAFVLIGALPLTLDGDIDRAALAEVPIVEEALAQRLERELLEDPHVEQAALFVDEIAAKPPALSIAEIVPGLGRLREAGTNRGGAAPAEPGGASDRPADALEREPGPPALCEGEAVVFPPGAPETLPGILAQNAERFAGKRITYLFADGSTREDSLGDLLNEGRRIAAALSARGLFPGRRVILQLVASEDILAAFWGCLIGGFVPAITPVPASYANDTNDLARLCHSHGMLDDPPIITTRELRASMGPLLERIGAPRESLLAIEELRSGADGFIEPEIDPGSPAFVVFTSGSTGMPKIIELSHRNILMRSEGTNRLCRHDEHDRILNWLPFDHIGSISDWHLRCVHVGCHMVYCAKEYVLGDPLNWLRVMDRFRVTHSWAPNFAYALVNDALGRSDEHWELSCMKALLTAGEAVSSNTVHEFLKRLAPHGLPHTALRPAFGMAELGSGVTYYQPTPEEPVRVQHVDRNRLEGALFPVAADSPRALGFTSLGPVIPGAAMRIVDEAGNVVPELTVGRLHIAGGPVCLGYYKNPDANREVFVGDGWFNTGDRGFIANRELYLTGRDKESLIINGANYHNGEIEHAVEEVEGIEVSFTVACAVRPPGDVEERLAVFFCPIDARPAALPQLLRRVQNSVARKTGVKPDFLLPIEPAMVPKTAIGKIQRKQLVKRFEGGEFDALVQRVEVLVEDERRTVPDWFLTPSWRSKALDPLERTGERAALLIADGYGLAEALGRELERDGVRAVVTARANVSAALDAEKSGFSDVFDLSGYEPALHGPTLADTAVERAASAVAESIERLKSLTDAKRPRAGASAARVFVVAAHAQAALPDDRVDPVRAMIPPLLKAVNQEQTVAACRHLDLPFFTDVMELEKLARILAGEARAELAEEEVSYRGERRLVRRFERVTWENASGAQSPLSAGAYVITGGLGGVGAALARYLLEHWGATLLILGRTQLSTNGDSAASGRHRGVLAELEKLGRVRYRALDVSRAAELGAAVAEFESELGQPIRGVFHLAGAYHERLFVSEDRSSLAAGFAPKVGGAVALQELLQLRPSAFVVYFGSLAGVFSGSGIAAYACANAFLDAFAHEQRAHHGVASYSLDWAVWKGLGIGAASAPAEILRAKGYYQLPPAQGFASLAALVSRPARQVLIGVDPASPSLRRLSERAPSAVLGLRGAYALKRAGSERARRPPEDFAPPRAQDRFGTALDYELQLFDALPRASDGTLDRAAILAELRGAAAPQVPPSTDLERQLVAIWKAVLGSESLGINQNFFELGGTSLLSVRLLAEIERQVGASLPPATLFQAATVQALAALIEAERPAAAEGPLITLAAGNSGRTLFLLHDIDGDTEQYRELAQHLAASARVCAVPPHASERFPTLHTRLAEMVGYYVERIVEAQSQGPYLIGGAGVGAVLAFEVACELQERGHRVALAALLDCPAPHARDLRRARGEGIRSWLGEHGGDLGAVPRTLAENARKELALLGKRTLTQARVRLFRYFADREKDPPWFLELISPRMVFDVIGGEYRPSRFRGKLRIFRPIAEPESGVRGSARSKADPSARSAAATHRPVEPAWQAYATDGIALVDVPAGPDGMLDEPYVATLAEQLSAAITQAVHASESN